MAKHRYEPMHLDLAIVRHYLIPAMRLVTGGHSATDAFARIARSRNVSTNTVYEHCTRKIGLSTRQFVLVCESGNMKKHLQEAFPKDAELLTGVNFS